MFSLSDIYVCKIIFLIMTECNGHGQLNVLLVISKQLMKN